MGEEWEGGEEGEYRQDVETLNFMGLEQTGPNNGIHTEKGFENIIERVVYRLYRMILVSIRISISV